jgi:hypothetical protein
VNRILEVNLMQTGFGKDGNIGLPLRWETVKSILFIKVMIMGGFP